MKFKRRNAFFSAADARWRRFMLALMQRRYWIFALLAVASAGAKEEFLPAEQAFSFLADTASPDMVRRGHASLETSMIEPALPPARGGRPAARPEWPQAHHGHGRVPGASGSSTVDHTSIRVLLFRGRAGTQEQDSSGAASL